MNADEESPEGYYDQVVQRLEQKIEALTQQISEKDRLIREKDEQIMQTRISHETELIMREI